ncbi:MAG: hypothetical protein II920_07520 [Clostridia bacterium]|nr:hypothetical protein [Clostridia bacterium]
MSKMDERKAAALEALLNSNSYSEAARMAGLSRRTLFDYLHNDMAFAEAYADARNALALERAEELAKKRKQAEQTIMDVMANGENDFAKLQAARTIIDMADKAAAKADSVAAENIQYCDPGAVLDRAIAKALS